MVVVAVRPALFVGTMTYVSEAMTVSQGQGGSQTFQLTASDFSPIGGGAPLDLQAESVGFGVVVGISCPETSTCGEVDRAVTIDELGVVVNPGLSPQG